MLQVWQTNNDKGLTKKNVLQMCCKCVADVLQMVINMQTQIDYVVDDPIRRKPEKVIIRYAGTENVIHRDEAQKLDNETVKLWLMLGLSKSQIQEIVGFLKS